MIKRIIELTRLENEIDNYLGVIDELNESDNNNNYSELISEYLDNYTNLKDIYDDLLEQLEILIEDIPDEKIEEMYEFARNQLQGRF